MKKPFAVLITLFFLFAGASAFAQRCETSIMKDISITEKSTEQTVTVEVEEGVSQLKLNVNCQLTTGKIIVEVYSPDGKRKGRLTLGETNTAENNGQKEDGKLMQEVEKPAKGIWTVKIVPTKSKADVRVYTSQITNN